MAKSFKFEVTKCMMTCAGLLFQAWLIASVGLDSLPVLSKRIEETPSRMIHLLLWTHVYPDDVLEKINNYKCLVVMNCHVTTNKTLLGNITNFDALLYGISAFYEDQSRILPMSRTRSQIYVFFGHESSNYYPALKQYDDFFNTSFSYKLNSDLYGGFVIIKNSNGEIIGPRKIMHWMRYEDMLPINDTIKTKLANKKVAAAWFVSNCTPRNKRNSVFKLIKQEMLKYGMTVDVYGGCGDKSCPRNIMDDCWKLIETDYYFYFAFENAMGEDYVTEKPLHALNHYAIPVVYGGANYTRYNDFFKWHNHYSYAMRKKSDSVCELCNYVKRMEVEVESKVIRDFVNWWKP
ncbi:Uncharacterized protein OBRU01_16416 [Operophtera brumata]|uniref:Fucosyltransferase n=1 Tax=Operophtera brumata TaxID=104452 RepID=A0A0L7L0H3_OPEBR|nr:Uncharacterized protein OBRU01_16416 [Operophtera brumata]